MFDAARIPRRTLASGHFNGTDFSLWGSIRPLKLCASAKII